MPNDIVIRLYQRGELVHYEKLDSAAVDLTALAEKHATEFLRLDEPHMIEIEFLDAPPAARFLRFGTDPSGMVIPIPLLIEPHN